jgi:hypothetical protein
VCSSDLQIVEEFGLAVIDATQPLVKQQDQVRALVKPHLEGALKMSSRGWRDVLSEESLLGRYLDGIGANKTDGDGDKNT